MNNMENCSNQNPHSRVHSKFVISGILSVMMSYGYLQYVFLYCTCHELLKKENTKDVHVFKTKIDIWRNLLPLSKSMIDLITEVIIKLG
jgi:hypothetical protein